MDRDKDIIRLMRMFESEADDYAKRAKKGNSQGEHKEIYAAKRDAYRYAARKIRNHLRWFGVIQEGETP